MARRMKPTHFLLLAAIFGWLAIQAGPAPAQDDRAKEEEAAKLGVEAAVYGFPLVIVDLTKRVQTNVGDPPPSDERLRFPVAFRPRCALP